MNVLESFISANTNVPATGGGSTAKKETMEETENDERGERKGGDLFISGGCSMPSKSLHLTHSFTLSNVACIGHHSDRLL